MDALLLVGLGAVSIIFLWFVTRNKVAIFWFAFAAVFMPADYIHRFFVSLPTPIKWSPLLILLSCTGLTVIFFRKGGLRMPPNLLWAYVLFLVVSLFSMFYNETSLGELIYAQRGFIFIICLIIVFKTIYTKYTLDDLYTFIVKIGLLMAGLALFERVVFVTLLRINSGDMITGTFGSDAQYLLFQLVCTIIVIAYWLTGKKLISLSPKNTLLILIGSIAIANNKAGVLFVIAVLGFFTLQVGYKILFQHMGKMIYLFIFIFIGAFTFDYLYQAFYKNSANKYGSYAYITDPDFMNRYLFGEDGEEDGMFNSSGRLRRGAAVKFAYGLIKKDMFNFLLGMGPGSTSASQGGGGGYLDDRYPGYNIDKSTISWLLAETGTLGLGLYILMLLAILYWRIPNGRKEHKIIKNTIVMLLLLYAPYENTVMMLVNGLIISVIIFPNYERIVSQNRKVRQEKTEEKKVHYFSLH